VALTETRRPLADPTRPAPARRPRTRRPRGELAGELVLGAALLAAYAGFHVLLQDISWFLAGGVFVVLVLAAATIARRLWRPSWLPTAVAAAVAVVGLTAGYAADVALVGVIPTPDVLSRFGLLTTQAWLSIAEQALPATPELGIVFLLAVLTAGCALFGDLVVRHAPALAVIPILTLLAVPVAVRGGVADPVWFVVAGAFYLALLRRGQAVAPRSWTIGSGVVLVALALVAPLVLPPVREADQPAGAGVGGAVNPIIDLGSDLRRGDPVTAVTYSTSSGQAVYLRLATLDSFDGREWAPSDTQPPASATIDRFPAPEGLQPAVDRTKLTAQVQVGNIAGRWLPVPYPASSIQGLDGDWRFVQGGLSVRSQGTSASGQKYGVDFLGVEPNLAQLQASSTADVAAVGDLDLPDRMPPIIAETARQVTAGATDEYEQALALQDYFSSTGGFTYSETAPVREGYDGTGSQIIAQFLQKKAGYCVHFASSMAVMARTLGIPARVVVGFQPGESSLNKPTDFTVSSHDLHAWPELYFSGIGWLRFEPTPGRGQLPVYSTPSAVDDSIASGQATGAATTAPSSTASSSASAGNKPLDTGPTGPAGSSTTSTAGSTAATIGITVGVLVALVLVLLIPAITRRVIRVRRLRAVARGRDPAGAAWAELRDTARDHGWSAPGTESVREFAGRLAVALTAQHDRLAGLTRDVEATAYAREPEPISADDVRAVVRAISATGTVRERLGAVLLPPSLVARVRADSAQSDGHF
jgi:hypothetical protein